LLRNNADAEDAAQECYLRAFRHFETFRGGPIKPWLLAILRNVCRAEYARRGMLAATLSDDLDEAECTSAGLWSETQSPEAETLQRLDGETVQRLIAQLPQAFREVIVLREVNDLSYREIADVTGVPVGTVMSRLRAGARAVARGVARGGEGLMTCDEAEVMLHALIDDELDAGHARDVEAHAATCARCAAQLAAYRDLQQAMQRNNLRYTAPASLRRSIDRVVPSPVTTSRRTLLKGFAIGSLASAAAASGLTLMVMREDQDKRILGEAVSAHLRSVQADHLTDVLSSDQHTVRPWFNGRIDLAPPVIDLTAQGFTLIGGRLDFIDGKPVAAIVYRRRVHVINLFVAQGIGTPVASPRLESVQGFNVRRWTDQGLNFLAISDLNRDELEEFATKFERAAGPAGAI
jgi:RNA polymerase sigma factor (sigma-70 family)